jgi:hypothetical protein
MEPSHIELFQRESASLPVILAPGPNSLPPNGPGYLHYAIRVLHTLRLTIDIRPLLKAFELPDVQYRKCMPGAEKSKAVISTWLNQKKIPLIVAIF